MIYLYLYLAICSWMAVNTIHWLRTDHYREKYGAVTRGEAAGMAVIAFIPVLNIILTGESFENSSFVEWWKQPLRPDTSEDEPEPDEDQEEAEREVEEMLKND